MKLSSAAAYRIVVLTNVDTYMTYEVTVFTRFTNIDLHHVVKYSFTLELYTVLYTTSSELTYGLSMLTTFSDS